MPRTEQSTAWDRLEHFVCDDTERSTEDIRKDLESDGVDVNAAIARIEQTVRTSAQSVWRKRAENERALAIERKTKLKAEMQVWPMDKVRQVLEEVAAGKFGVQGQELAIACRNRTETQKPTDEELRVYLADILSCIKDTE
jgi:hypothetical protein